MKKTLQKSLSKSIKNQIRVILDVFSLFYGTFIYQFFKKRIAHSHLSMIRIFCKTGGRSNDLISSCISLVNKPYIIPTHSGVLGQLNQDKLQKINQHLLEQGYHVFDTRLPKSICDKLLKNAMQKPCYLHAITEQGSVDLCKSTYSRDTPRATKYSFHIQDLINWPEIQDLISDPGFLAISQQYFKSKAYFDQTMLWWSTSFNSSPDSDAAQMYHFDMDRFKWLKFFIYLTNVTPETGPHTFVAGSHKTKGIPKEILKKGYSRLTDAEIEKFYPSEKIITFTGSIGTIIVEDTRGLHKGKHLLKDDRLILEIQFSNHLFGASLDEGKFIKKTSSLEQSLSKFPKSFSNYT